MQVIKQIDELRDFLDRKRQANQTIGLVPTMGYLHEGHLSLIAKAKEQMDVVVLSIFVNPLQFGENEDFSVYPRDLERDEKLAADAGVDVVFAPEAQEMYPHQPKVSVHVSTQLTKQLCGRSRPTHFDGVATVVLKLFQIVAPHRAYFGLKDAQQIAVIQQMIDDFNLPLSLVACPTIRETDGLAKSSRNVNLTPEQRQAAPVLYKALQRGRELLLAGRHTPDEVTKQVKDKIQQSSGPIARIDYVECLTWPELEPLEPKLQNEQAYVQERTVILAVAVYYGPVRLIDNLLIGGKKGGMDDAENIDASETTSRYSNGS